MKHFFRLTLGILTIGSFLLAQDLFFSEYIEGSSNNKAFEIYNPTGSEVDLSSYVILQTSNGGPWDEYVDQLEGMLAAGDVYVIANGSSDQAILDETDLTGSGIAYHNGDDARALVKLVFDGSETDYIDLDGDDVYDDGVIVLDVIGTVPDDPGSGWDVAGVTNATQDHTLVRKATVAQGNSDWAASAGTNTEDSEWMVFAQNTFEYLGPTLTATNRLTSMDVWMKQH